MNVVSIQPTPNPNAFKFVLDAVVVRGTKNYASKDEAKGDGLATEIFGIDGVERVFLCDAFITVSMTPEADWRAVHEAATRVIEAADAPDLESADAAPAAGGSGPNLDGLSHEVVATLEKINELLDDRVRPALAGDGGGLEVIGLEGKTLHIRYEGACGTCPSAATGTLMAIESLLQSEVDADMSVVPA